MAFWDNPSELTPKQSHRWVISFGQKNDLNSQNHLPFYFAKSIERPSYSLKTIQAKYLYSHTINFPTRVTWNPITITFNDVLINVANSSYLFQPTIETYNQFIKDGGKIKQQLEIPPEDRTLVVESSRVTNFRQSTQAFFYKFLQFAGYFDPEEYGRLTDELLSFKSYTFKNSLISAFVGSDITNDSNQLNAKATQLSAGKTAEVSNEANLKELYISEFSPSGEVIEKWLISNPLISDVKFDRLDYSTDNILSITAKIEYDWARLSMPGQPSNVTEQLVFSSLEQRQQSDFALAVNEKNADEILKIAEKNLKIDPQQQAETVQDLIDRGTKTGDRDATIALGLTAVQLVADIEERRRQGLPTASSLDSNQQIEDANNQQIATIETIRQLNVKLSDVERDLSEASSLESSRNSLYTQTLEQLRNDLKQQIASLESSIN
jgi:hypothetical protein